MSYNINASEDVGFREEVNKADQEKRAHLLAQGWWHSIDLGNGQVTPGARGIDELRDQYNCFGLPQDLTGKRLLDIGCWDGFFSFEAEKHGAEVVAIDCWRSENLLKAKTILNSRVDYREMSVYEISRNKLGRFDIVLFLGVIYHLQHPLLALQRVCDVTHDVLLMESHVIDGILSVAQPVMEFYEYDELGGQYDNWWGPNTDCLVRMARAAGFVRHDVLRREPARAVIKAHRTFSDITYQEPPAIQILDIINACTYEHHFPASGRHAYLQIWAEGMLVDANRENVRVMVGPYGALPTYVGQVDGGELREFCRMVINVPIPPGVGLGSAPVQVFYQDQSSAQFEINISAGSEW